MDTTQDRLVELRDRLAEMDTELREVLLELSTYPMMFEVGDHEGEMFLAWAEAHKNAIKVGGRVLAYLPEGQVPGGRVQTLAAPMTDREEGGT